MSCQWKVSNWS